MSIKKVDFEQNDISYVGFWSRFAASIIDSVFVLLITMPLLYLIYGKSYFMSMQPHTGVVYSLINYVLPIVVIILFWIYKAATPGKMAVSAIIVDHKTGNKPTLLQSVLRYVGYYISLIPLGLGFIWVAFDSKKQGWHDKIAGTVIVRINKKKI